MNKIICPVCKQNGLKSIVKLTEKYFLREDKITGLKSLGSYPDYTLIEGKREAFYDEEGNFHAHDGNIRKTKYYCSNGHLFQIAHKYKCSVEECEWNIDREDVYTILNEETNE